ncbi:Asp-tRNA(Asn)/Glu-tRNA(Gln) amidotransferase subunit GatC [Candidatus Curtissbacteria bacterium]|nr:Asp-tRNA(Asn)/Glu-tRNA(Gln) amidotransferase subunit GatC [Candidatus Curtissbacteria bacterium]
MSKVKIDINHVSKLANLNLTKEEKEKFEKQLSSVLTYISQLNEIETEGVEPIGHITGMVNVLREDEPRPSLSQEDSLLNASKKQNGFFQVDSIFEE